MQPPTGDSGLEGPQVVRSTSCVICDAPFGRRTRVLVLEESETSQVESHWVRWLEQRRVERWIWFGFLTGLALVVAAFAMPF